MVERPSEPSSIPFPWIVPQADTTDTRSLILSMRPTAKRLKGRVVVQLNVLGDPVVLKTVPRQLGRAETEAAQFVLEHTSIPVPRVRDYWEDDRNGYILTDHAPGECLAAVWTDLSAAQRTHVMQTLAGLVRELRTIPQPSPRGSNLPRAGWLGSARGNGSFDVLINQRNDAIGPWPDERTFNEWRISLYKMFGDAHQPTAERLAQIQDEYPVDSPIVFTHGDISGLNVLVRVNGDGADDVEVTALLDWAQAGWRPLYWEGVKWWRMEPYWDEWLAFNRAHIYPGYERVQALEVELLQTSGLPPCW